MAVIGPRNEFRRAVLLALVLTASVLGSGEYEARSRGPQLPSRPKLDRVLRKAVETGDRSAKRVIIRTKPGKSADVSRLLAGHGDVIRSRHGLVDAISASVHGGVRL